MAELGIQDQQSSWAHDGWELMTTDEMREALMAGEELELFPTDASVLETANVVTTHRNIETTYNPDIVTTNVARIEDAGKAQVQCIMLDDPEHLYVTDDGIATHNTADIIFMKSTDNDMLQTLSDMSGKTHQTYTTQKSVTRDLEKIAMQNEGKISYTTSTNEVPVISYNDLAFIPPRNFIVFVAGGIGDKSSASVVWDRNETALPMSWRLFKTQIRKPGTDYSLQTIPTLSSAIDFDVRANMPNFADMIVKRLEQALYVEEATQDYKDAYGLTDDGMARLDQDVVADEIMDIVRRRVELAHAKGEYLEIDGVTPSDAMRPPKKDQGKNVVGKAEDNDEMRAEAERREREAADMRRGRYAGGTISRYDLTAYGGSPTHALDDDIVRAFLDTRAYFERDRTFAMRPDGLHLANGTPLIVVEDQSANVDTARRAWDEGHPRMKTGVPDGTPESSWQVTDDMYRWLAGLETWANFASGRFEAAMARQMQSGSRVA